MSKEGIVPETLEYIPLSRMLADADGKQIAAIFCGVDEDDSTWIDGIRLSPLFQAISDLSRTDPFKSE